MGDGKKGLPDEAVRRKVRRQFFAAHTVPGPITGLSPFHSSFPPLGKFREIASTPKLSKKKKTGKGRGSEAFFEASQPFFFPRTL